MEKLFNNEKWKKQNLIFIAAAILCLSPVISSPIALLLGFTLAILGLVPKQINLNLLTKNLLAYSIIGLGFGINLDQAIAASKEAFGLIILSLLSTLIIGWLLTKRLGINSKTGYLISSGTAICGGSAIAAVAPAINASKDQTSIALATVFLLNSVALFLFPFIGHLLSMTQHAFGVWCAIAIHDTSSVV
ncbi:MAG: putative membrane protein YadS, partial [Sphingobacteriales bacterium]